MSISLIASAVRTEWYISFLASLRGTSIPLEVVFAGFIDPKKTQYWPAIEEILKYEPIEFKYIVTENIKPAQCYEVARRNATYELIHWTADDAEYTNDFLGKAYNYWVNQNNKKLILSLQTIENYGFAMMTDMKNHSFFGGHPETPLMAPLGLMSREYLNELGGFDRRYICGQYENDVVMRVLVDGGKVEVFGDKMNYIELNHIEKHGGMPGHVTRPFATGYASDRRVLEDTWARGFCKMSKEPLRPFEPYEDENILTQSQSFYGQWGNK